MKIQGELDELETERAKISVILKSRAKLQRLVRDEIEADAAKYGDARRSPLVSRTAATALREADLVPSEPITLVLSQKGWVRSAKGHEIDAATLGYREGDGLGCAARGRSNQQAVFFDSTGRSYSTPAHTLPSARGNGEPLSGRFDPPSGASFDACAIADADARMVIATSHGYGFVAKFESLFSRNKAGKQTVSLTKGAHVLAPAHSPDPARDRIVVATNGGHILMFSVAELPELDKGKGNKLIQIPKSKLQAGGERAVGVVVIPEGGECVLWAGQRKLNLRWGDLVDVGGHRAIRGSKLPRGFQRVDRIERA
jgi:topoisomerase-4 subunit A